MTWFKVDDKLHGSSKARLAGKSAMGVWLLAGSWSSDHLTDGFIPAAVLPLWGTKGDAARLVNADLWYEDVQKGERGWRFKNWEEYQPTRAHVEEVRAKRAEVGRRGGKASAKQRSKQA